MQYGRQEILTDVEEITEENIRKVVSEALEIHRKNQADIKKLRDIERGNQDILNRIKEIRPEINNKVVENHASEVTAFKVGYVFGSPITYVQRANKDIAGNDSNIDDARISLLNEMLFEESKASKDQQLARDFSITGVGYRIALPKVAKNGSSVFDLLTLNPETTFVVKRNDIYKKTILGCSYSVTSDKKIKVGAYTDNLYFELEGIEGATDVKVVKTEVNRIGVQPIIQYVNDYDRMGCFERALTLIDAINNATSDRINAIEQFVQAFIWMNNCLISEEDFNELRAQGGLCTSDMDGRPASVQYLIGELNQADTQTVIDDLYDKILQICCVPGREASTGGNTGQAILLSNGWQLAETSAKNAELVFCNSERELLNVILAILKKNTTSVSFEGFNSSDIDIKFTRNRTDGLIVKTQSLQGMLQAGIHPLKALEVCGLFSDPQQAWNDSKPYMNKWLFELEETNNGENTIPEDI